AVEEHLAEREERADMHAVGVEARRVAVERAVAPFEEREVVAEAAEERLERVVVRVDRAGEERAPAPVDDAGALRRHLAGGADGDDDAVLDPHRGRAARLALDERAVGLNDGCGDGFHDGKLIESEPQSYRALEVSAQWRRSGGIM